MSESWNDLIPPAAGLSAHLSDAELAAVDMASLTEKHLADCAWCQHRRDALSGENRQELAALLEELEASDVPQSTVQATSAWSLPTALAAALQADSSQWPAVAPSQLWRLSWRGTDALGVVLERDSWWARIAPLTTDVALADEYTLLLDGDSTPLSEPAGIFVRATVTVPSYTLAWFLGNVASAGTDVHGALRRLEAAHLEQSPAPEDLPTGPVLTPDDWDRLETLDALIEEMGCFASASYGVLDESGPVVGTSTAADEDSSDVAELLNQRGLDLAALAESTGLDDFRLLDLKSGRIQPSPEDRAALSKHFKAPVRGSGHSLNKRMAALDVVCDPSSRRYWFGWHASDGSAAPEDCLVPFTEDLLSNQKAARSLQARPGPDADLTRDEWRKVFWDQLAMHHPHS